MQSKGYRGESARARKKRLSEAREKRKRASAAKKRLEAKIAKLVKAAKEGRVWARHELADLGYSLAGRKKSLPKTRRAKPASKTKAKTKKTKAKPKARPKARGVRRATLSKKAVALQKAEAAKKRGRAAARRKRERLAEAKRQREALAFFKALAEAIEKRRKEERGVGLPPPKPPVVVTPPKFIDPRERFLELREIAITQGEVPLPPHAYEVIETRDYAQSSGNAITFEVKAFVNEGTIEEILYHIARMIQLLQQEQRRLGDENEHPVWMVAFAFMAFGKRKQAVGSNPLTLRGNEADRDLLQTQGYSSTGAQISIPAVLIASETKLEEASSQENVLTWLEFATVSNFTWRTEEETRERRLRWQREQRRVRSSGRVPKGFTRIS